MNPLDKFKQAVQGMSMNFGNAIKSGGKAIINSLPPVQAYNAVKIGYNALNQITPGGIQGGVNRVKQSFQSPQQYFMPTSPQARQTTQNIANWGANLSQKGQQFGQQIGQQIQNTPQFKVNPIQDFKINMVKKSAPLIASMIGSIPGEIVRGTAQAGREISEPSRFIKAPLTRPNNFFGTPQQPTKAGIAIDVLGAGFDVSDVARAGIVGAFGAGIAKSSLDAKALKRFLPEIRNVSKMLGNMNEIPFLTPRQVETAEEIVTKIRGSNAIKQIQKLNPDPKDYLNSIRVILGGAEDQILNPGLNIGFTTKNLKLPHKGAQAGLSVQPKDVNPLIQEAKKYGSAEEFYQNSLVFASKPENKKILDKFSKEGFTLDQAKDIYNQSKGVEGVTKAPEVLQTGKIQTQPQIVPAVKQSEVPLVPKQVEVSTADSSSKVIIPQKDKYAFNINKERLGLKGESARKLDEVVEQMRPVLEKRKGAPLTNKQIIIGG
ncbi:hypothetical protein M0R04_16665, partial [Candidatus Dojkabacteria bacterium]|nr:hypothetical protein [Candidatus Dojkabacteria bacterium]